MKIGDRVVILGEEALSRWTRKAQFCLANKKGTIARISDGGALIALDITPDPWWENQRPGKCWWFNTTEFVFSKKG